MIKAIIIGLGASILIFSAIDASAGHTTLTAESFSPIKCVEYIDTEFPSPMDFFACVYWYGTADVDKWARSA